MARSHPLELRRRANALPEENITVSEKLGHLQRNFNQALQKFGELEPCSRHSFPELKFSKDLSALVGYLNSKILPLHLDTKLSVLQAQTLSYCAAMAVVRTLRRKTMPCRNTIRSQTRNNSPWKIRLQNEVSKIRCKLGRLTPYRKGNTACKLPRKAADIFYPRKVHATTPAELDEVMNSLRQRLCILSSRLRRYNVTSDSIAVPQAKEHQRNLQMAYVDYNQPFPMVPRDYLIDILKACNICPCSMQLALK